MEKDPPTVTMKNEKIFFCLFCWVTSFEQFLNNEIRQSTLDSTETSVTDYLRETLPRLIHKFNFQSDGDLQILEFTQGTDTVPNCIFCIQRNLFLIDIGEQQCFKFIFWDADIYTLLAVTLRRLGITSPLTQIVSSKVPLIEMIVKVTTSFFTFIFF